MDTLRRLDSEQQAAYGDRASAIRTSMSFALLPASPQLSEQVAALLRSQADAGRLYERGRTHGAS